MMIIFVISEKIPFQLRGNRIRKLMKFNFTLSAAAVADCSLEILSHSPSVDNLRGRSNKNPNEIWTVNLLGKLEEKVSSTLAAYQWAFSGYSEPL